MCFQLGRVVRSHFILLRRSVVAQVRSSPIEDVKDENKKEERERSYGSLQFFFIQGTDDFRNRVKSFILIPRVSYTRCPKNYLFFRSACKVSNERSEIYIWPKCNTCAKKTPKSLEVRLSRLVLSSAKLLKFLDRPRRSSYIRSKSKRYFRISHPSNPLYKRTLRTPPK